MKPEHISRPRGPCGSSAKPFPHQQEALETWWQQGGRGVVVLPTGTGKTHLAILAIQKAGRPSLVIAPTIDLMNQWYDELTEAFGVPSACSAAVITNSCR